MRLPQELVDKVAAYTGSVKMTIALGACPTVIATMRVANRARIVGDLEAFMASPLAKHNGMGCRTDSSVEEEDRDEDGLYSLRMDFRVTPSHVGWWVVLEHLRDSFVHGETDGIRVMAGYSDNHYVQHRRSLLKECQDLEPEEREDVCDERCDGETMECVDTHVTCILALAGYVVNRRGDVVGKKFSSGSIRARNPTALLEICPCWNS
jgi:hypothetical protein